MALNFVTFNQDFTVLGVATSNGFRLYTTEPFAKYYENDEGDVSIMEMLFSTSLVALVLSPRLLRILNTKKNTTICELTFPMKILAVRMNRKRLAVVLEESIYLYDISNMKLLHTIETSPNPHALCALSPHSENNYMAYPQPSKQPTQPFNQPAHTPPTANNLPPSTGEVLIYNTNTKESVNVIVAHQSTLGCLSINSTGTMLATASEKGTIIRVFSVPMGEKLFHFRRGSLPAHIYCMSFNAASSLLSVSSATETVHVFRLVAQQSPFRPQEAPETPTRSPPASPARRRGESFSSLSRERSASPSSEDQAGTPTDGAASAALAAAGAGPGAAPAPARPGQTLASMIRRTSQNVGLSLAARVGGYLPASVTEMWEPARDFAWVRIPRFRASASGAGSGAGGAGTGAVVVSSPAKSVVAMSSGRPQLLVVTSEGQFLVFNIDLDKGGEGVLERQYSVVNRRTSLAYANDD